MIESATAFLMQWVLEDPKRAAVALAVAAGLMAVSAAASFVDNAVPGFIDSHGLRRWVNMLMVPVRIINRYMTPQGLARTAAGKINPNNTARRNTIKGEWKGDSK